MKNSKFSDLKKADIEYEARRIQREYSARTQFQAAVDVPEWFQWRKQQISQLLDLSQKDKILDFGSGTSEISEWLASSGFDITALDISFELLAFSNNRSNSTINYVVGDCENTPFGDEQFDKIICWELLHHLPDSARGIQEIYRILKRGGRTLFIEPNALNPLRRLRELEVRKKHKILEKSFYPWELAKMVEKSGFDRLAIKHVFPPSAREIATDTSKTGIIRRIYRIGSRKYLPWVFGSLMMVAQK